VQQICATAQAQGLAAVSGTVNSVRSPSPTSVSLGQEQDQNDDDNEDEDQGKGKAMKKGKGKVGSALKIVTMTSSAGRVHNVLYAPASSPLLQCDRYLLDKELFDSSLRFPFLAVGSPVRRLFASEPDDFEDGEPGEAEAAEYLEGIVYSVRADFRQNPYNSVLVIWTSQEEDSRAWVYSYSQSSNECSPWDLEPSAFKRFTHQYAPPSFPRCFTSVSLEPQSIIDYLSSHNAGSEFSYNVSEVSQEYRDMFPAAKDHLCLPVLAKLCKRGRYSVDAAGVGIATLFRDLERMTANSKQFNSSNANFLPWRLADFMEKTV
jgi:hypothetical protein